MAVTIGELEARLHADVSSFISGMQQAQNAFQQTSRSISQGSSNMNGLTSTINGVQNAVGKLSSKMNMAFAAIGAGFILPQIFSAAKTAVIDFNQQVDQASVALTNFLGSATASKEMIAELQDFAAKTPFQFKDLLSTTQSMMAMGVAAEDVLPRMQAIGDAAAAMGGSPEVLARIQRALGQIQAKGRVQSEELLQLAEAGIPAYQYLADAMGTTTAELMNSMKQGAVDSTTAVNALLDGMARDFGGMMEEQSKTMMGAMSTVMDYVQMTVGAIFRPLFETLRDAFVAISNLLSSEGMKTGAANFASSVASVITSIKELIGAFSKSLAKPFMDIIKAMGSLVTVGVRLAKALKPMVTVVLIPLGAAIAVVAKVLAPLIKGIAKLAEFISRNEIVISALASLLMAKVVTSFLASGKAALFFGSAISKSMSLFGFSGKVAALEFQKLRASGVGTFAAIRGSAQYAGISVKGFGLALQTVMLKLLPLMIAFMIIGKLYQAFSDRNKDAKARAEELTGAVKEQTDAVLSQDNALTALAGKGMTILNEALVGTGEEGKETTNQLIAVGKSANDYVQTMRDFKSDTEAASKAIAIQNGFTEEQAAQMAAYVKNNDKGSDAMHYQRMATAGFTKEMIKTTLALEQLDDASENTNFGTMTREIIQATIRSNEATQQFYDEAIAVANLAATKNKNMTEDEKALIIYQEFLRRSSAYEVQQMKIALANDKLGVTSDSATKRMTELITTMKDGKVEAEDFLRALMGAANFAATSAKQSYFEMGVALKKFGTDLKQTRGNQNALRQAGYDFKDMLAENQARILAMGGTLGDLDSSMQQMVSTFIAQGKAAGWSEKHIKNLLISMGLLKDNGSIILTVDVRIKTLKGIAAKALKAGDTQAYNAAKAELAQLQTDARALNLDIAEIDLGGDTGGGKGSERYQTFLDHMKGKVDIVRDHLEDLKKSSEDLRLSIVNAVVSTYSFSNAYSEMTDSQNEFLDAQKELASAQEDVNKALMSRDINAYNEALKRVATASQQATTAESKRLTFMQSLTKQYEKAVKFQDMLVALQKAGLNQAGLDQIIAAGAETGTLMGQELLNAGSSEILRANTMYDTLKSSAQTAATAVSGEYYDSGIALADSLLKGIKDTVKNFKLKLTGKALSAEQLAKMKKDFKFETEVTMTAVRTAQSAVAMASGGIVMPRSGGTIARIGEAGYPEAVIPLNRSVFNRVMPNSGGAQNTYEIHVNAGVGDPQEIGRTIVEYLKGYERRYGNVPIRTQ